jgi:uncharacterized protein YbjT (DUF2867 family)
MRIVVNTPNGHIGRALVRHLLTGGAEVTGIARDPAKVADLAGLRVVQGDLEDEAVLARAFEGADAVFWLSPPAVRPDYVDWAAANARRAAGVAKRLDVRRAVVLSSIGAQNGPGTGPIAAVAAAEDAFRAALPDVAALRPGYFFENLFNSAATLAGAGALFLPLPAGKKFPMVATADIAAKAAEALLAEWRGHRTVGVHGPADLSHDEVTAVLSEALGRPIRYVEVTVEQARAGMQQAGLPDFAARLYGEMYQAMIDGRVDPAEPRTPETTTPTTLAAFARDVLRPALVW